MKKVLKNLTVASFLLLSHITWSADYYVSPGGSDNNIGTLSQPFKTIGKAASKMLAGDKCYIRQGRYHETVIPANSGTSGNEIVFQSYNSESVTIDGADTLTGFVNYSGNIYKAIMNWDLGAENQVFINNVMVHEARWPNIRNQADPFFDHKNYGRASSSSNDGKVNDPKLPSKPADFWKGCTLWGNFGVKWTSFGTPITSSNNQDVFYTTPTNLAGWYATPNNTPWGTNMPNDFEMYYLSGKLALLDTVNEWYYDKTTQAMYVYVIGSISSNVITAKKRGKAFDISNRSYISIKNLGINASTVKMYNANYCTIDNIIATYINHHSSLGYSYNLSEGFVSGNNGFYMAGNNNTIKNSIFKYSAGSAIYVSGPNHTIDNNDIQNTNYAHSYTEGISTDGTNSNLRITRNKIWYSGSCLISCSKQGTNDDGAMVFYNDFAFAEQLGDDRGGINGSNWEVAYNYIHDIGKGLKYGATPGLYTDLAEDYATYHHNSIWNLNGTDGALRINNTGNANGNVGILILNNTSYNIPNQAQVIGNNGIWTLTNAFHNAATSNFQNTLLGDFKLTSGSNAINAGIIISTPYDITKGYIGTAPDKGAYEFGGSDGQSNWKVGKNAQMYYLGNGIWDNSIVTGLSSNGLTAEYFNNTTLNAASVLNRTDATVNFNWGKGSPGTAVTRDYFSARWIGFVEPEFDQTYTFYVNSNDGNRLWVNGIQITNRWYDGPIENQGTISLTAGTKYTIKLEMYEGVGNALAQLSWSSASQPKQIIPTNRLFKNNGSSLRENEEELIPFYTYETEIYPNPSNGQLNFRNHSIYDKIEIIDITGNLVHSEIISGKESITIETGNISSGLYFAKLIGINGKQDRKIELRK